MNRLQSPTNVQPGVVPVRSSVDPAACQIEFGRITSDDHLSLSLFAPQHYEASYRYPLLIWLHGPAGDERQLHRVMPLVSLRNYVAVAPRGTQAMSVRGIRCYDWRQDDQHFAEAEQRIWNAIELAQTRFHIGADRIFLAGLQSGGTMAYRFAFAHPDALAGVLSIGGPVATGFASLRRLPELRRLQFFATYACEDPDYPPAAVGADLRLFHAAGMRLHLRQYPGSDALTTEMLADVDRWIMEIVTGVPCEVC